MRKSPKHLTIFVYNTVNKLQQIHQKKYKTLREKYLNLDKSSLKFI